MPTLEGRQYGDGDVAFEITRIATSPTNGLVVISYVVHIKRKDGWTQISGHTKILEPVVITAKDIHDGHANKGGRSGEAAGN